MTTAEVLSALEALGNERVRDFNLKHGVGSRQQFGVMMGDIRALAKKIKANHALGLELWATGNIDARLLATQLINHKKLSAAEVARMVSEEPFTQVADRLYAYVVKLFSDTEPLRREWMHTADVMQARAGWSLTSGCVARSPELLDLTALLHRIEAEMPTAPPEVQWTMNSVLANIGIYHPQHRARALAIGEKLGIYRDYPVSKGCTSPFAPIWINEMVRRQG